MVAFFLFVAGASLLQAQTSYRISKATILEIYIAGIGWSQADVKASVANDPLASGNKVLNGYNQQL